MIQGSMGANIIVYILLAVVFIVAILLPYPRLSKKKDDNARHESH
jgi:hypothetical protein